jgi:hypothetical protein
MDWFVDPNGEVIVDYIGKFEQLAEDWAEIERKIGAPSELPHLKKNPERKRHYTEYYAQSLQDIVRDQFCVDSEYFGYEFGAYCGWS